jgi:hypothetical protein
MAAVLERQERLAEQMRDLEQARLREQRRAAELGETMGSSQLARAGANTARGTLLDDLRGADNLRRAVVLREVLGAPVGLRPN